ncbi:hypothetical protein C882_2330 [Caenispirillum salinarum AK4]|uniref:Uncharacterized protein n=1 Tax=Caenispirillum salinarum AK4 TaxID=1238182 RepID=K9GN91_9PROT|nr:tetratricopeptide repeat-containing sulfotransferase family protein [Caenispirillum salinarum]EKV26557.1 hypothetical protein C882_2330 [Caenispirillum salinarum AK4]
MTQPPSPERTLALAKAAERNDDPMKAALLFDALASAGQHEAEAKAGLDRLAERAEQAEQALPAEAVDALRTLCHEGAVQEAEAQARALAEKLPDALPLYEVLGEVFLAQRKPEAASAVLAHAARVQPDDPGRHEALADAAWTAGLEDEALEAMEQAAALAPDDAVLKTNLARMYQAAGRLEDALAAYDAVVALAPHQAPAFNNRGQLYFDMGRMAEAERDFEEAVRLRPTLGNAHRMLAAQRRYTAGHPHMEAMRTVLGKGDLAPDERTHVEFALAKALEDIGAYDEAFALLRTANDRQRQAIGGDGADRAAAMRHAARLFVEPLLSRMIPQPSPDERPIFIVGMPRSGTSLAEQILASHPAVEGAGEVALIGKTLGRWLTDGRITPDASPRLIAEYGRLLDRHTGPETLRVVDKMPFNFIWLAWIARAFPNARIIHMQRDPMDVGLSIYKTLFSDSDFSFGFDLQDIAAVHLACHDLMAEHRRLLGDRVFTCRYEDLVSDQEGQSRRLLAHCGLEWDERVLDFHKTRRAVRTASATQVRRRMYTSSVKAWQKYGDHLAPLRDALAPIL